MEPKSDDDSYNLILFMGGYHDITNKRTIRNKKL